MKVVMGCFLCLPMLAAFFLGIILLSNRISFFQNMEKEYFFQVFHMGITMYLFSSLFLRKNGTFSQKDADNEVLPKYQMSYVPANSLELIFFGLSRPDGRVVSESEWQEFGSNYIASVFKEGHTIIDANGQWMLETREMVKEKIKILVLLHKNDKEISNAIDSVTEAYKKLFEQESVLRVSFFIEFIKF